MGKTAGKGGKNDGEKASKGLGPSNRNNKKAPKASSEELSEVESDEDSKNKKKAIKRTFLFRYGGKVEFGIFIFCLR